MFNFFKPGIKDPAQQTVVIDKDKKDDTTVIPPKTGLDKFQEMMDNAVKAREESAKAGDTKPKPVTANSFLTPENKKALMDGVDFTKAISEETLAELASGKAEAVLKAIQEVGKQSYGTALEQATILADTAIQSRNDITTQELDTLVADKLRASKVDDAIPGADNPIIQLGITAFRQELEAASPDATPEEVAAQIKEYVAELHTAINPSQDEDTPEEDKPTDWLAYAGTSQE